MALSLSKAWDETSAFLTKESRLIMPVALATFGLPAVLAGWVNPAGTDGGGVTSVLMLLVLVLALIGQVTIIRLALGYRGRIGDAMRAAAGRVPALIGAFLIFIVPLAVIGTLLISIVLIATGNINDLATMKPDQMAKMPAFLLGISLMVLVVLFFAIRLFPMSSVAAAEDGGPMHIIRRAWDLTKGYFGPLLVLFLLVMLASAILNGAVTTVVGAVAKLALGDATPFSLSALVVALATGFVSAIVSAVSSSLAGRVYAQLSNYHADVADTFS